MRWLFESPKKLWFYLENLFGIQILNPIRRSFTDGAAASGQTNQTTKRTKQKNRLHVDFKWLAVSSIQFNCYPRSNCQPVRAFPVFCQRSHSVSSRSFQICNCHPCSFSKPKRFTKWCVSPHSLLCDFDKQRQKMTAFEGNTLSWFSGSICKPSLCF